MNGQTYDRGVAVHSRSVLTYDLNGRYATFEALVGFDDASQGQGRVDCRVFADGKEIYANPDLQASDPPVKLSLPIAGAEQLRLQVDYGRGQDTGDRVIWANARLYRPAAAQGRGRRKSKPAERRVRSREARADAKTKKPSMTLEGSANVAQRTTGQRTDGCIASSFDRLWLSIAPAGRSWAPRSAPRDSTTRTRTRYPQSPIEVYEWSIWVGNPAQTTMNTTRIYKNAMPSSVGTSRPKFEEKDLADKFPVAPISVVQFFGEPCKDVDVDLRAKKGTLPLALAAEHRARRPAPVVQVGPLRRSAREHPAELSRRRTTGCRSCAQGQWPSTSSTSRTTSGSSPTTPSWRSPIPRQDPRRSR